MCHLITGITDYIDQYKDQRAKQNLPALKLPTNLLVSLIENEV